MKSLNETYDVRIQASQKDDVVMGERVITVVGSEDGESFYIRYIIYSDKPLLCGRLSQSFCGPKV